MSPFNPHNHADQLRDIRRKVDQIRYSALSKEPSVDVPTACLGIVKTLRKMEDGFRLMPAPAPVVSVTPPPTGASVPVVTDPKPQERPTEAPQPKRKPGRPRKNPIPSEPGGVA